MVDSVGADIYSSYQVQNFVQIIFRNMLTLILYLTGIIGFALFYKFIDWFEKI
jgi:hypothetical protein